MYSRRFHTYYTAVPLFMRCYIRRRRLSSAVSAGRHLSARVSHTCTSSLPILPLLLSCFVHLLHCLPHALPLYTHTRRMSNTWLDFSSLQTAPQVIIRATACTFHSRGGATFKACACHIRCTSVRTTAGAALMLARAAGCSLFSASDTSHIRWRLLACANKLCLAPLSFSAFFIARHIPIPSLHGVWAAGMAA